MAKNLFLQDALTEAQRLTSMAEVIAECAENSLLNLRSIAPALHLFHRQLEAHAKQLETLMNGGASNE